MIKNKKLKTKKSKTMKTGEKLGMILGFASILIAVSVILNKVSKIENMVNLGTGKAAGKTETKEEDYLGNK